MSQENPLRKSQPTFSHYVKKIKAQAKKKWFSYKKKACNSSNSLNSFGTIPKFRIIYFPYSKLYIL